MPYGDNQGGGDFQRTWFDGEWACAKCGNKITRLPFKPDPSRLDQLLCQDCHREKRQAFRGGGGRSFGR